MASRTGWGRPWRHTGENTDFRMRGLASFVLVTLVPSALDTDLEVGEGGSPGLPPGDWFFSRDSFLE